MTPTNLIFSEELTLNKATMSEKHLSFTYFLLIYCNLFYPGYESHVFRVT